MYPFEKLGVWKESVALTKLVYKLAEKFPVEEKYSHDQIYIEVIEKIDKLGAGLRALINKIREDEKNAKSK